MIMLDSHDARSYIPLLDQEDEEFFVWEANGSAHVARYDATADKFIAVSTSKVVDNPRYFAKVPMLRALEVNEGKEL
jgi:hypothetical protein